MWGVFFIAKYYGLISINSVDMDILMNWKITQASWSEAKQFCCKLGMHLVSVYSVDKQDCLSNTFQNTGITLQIYIFYTAYLNGIYGTSRCKSF
jgi:hypothetical protein